jgi:hypothetical protein
MRELSVSVRLHSPVSVTVGSQIGSQGSQTAMRAKWGRSAVHGDR